MNATYRIGVSGFRKRQCTPCQRDWLVLRAGFGKDENIKNIATCAVAIWLGAAIKQQKYNSRILPSAL